MSNIRYVDQIGYYQSSSGGSALGNVQYRDTDFKMLFFNGGDTEISYWTFQFNHNKALNLPVKSIHIHCIPLEAPAGGSDFIEFQVKYFWNAGYMTEIPLASGWTTVSPNVTTEITSDMQYKHMIYNLATDIPAPANEGYSSVLLVNVTRLGAGLFDDYGDLGLLYVDCHYPTDRDGSIYEYSDVPPGTI